MPHAQQDDVVGKYREENFSLTDNKSIVAQVPGLR